MMLKDLKLAQDAAKATRRQNRLGADAEQIYAQYVDERRGCAGFFRHHSLRS